MVETMMAFYSRPDTIIKKIYFINKKVYLRRNFYFYYKYYEQRNSEIF